jgi:hypothetical protein
MTPKPKGPNGDGDGPDGKPKGEGSDGDDTPSQKHGSIDASKDMAGAQDKADDFAHKGRSGGGGEGTPKPPETPGQSVHTRPSGQPDPNATPGGTPTKLEGSAEARENLRIENDSATTLARAGYKIDQNTGDVGANGRSKPDYKMEGQLWDCYAPRDNRETIRRELRKKVKDQSPNIVINMEKSSWTVEDMKAVLPTVKGLKEVKIIDQNGNIIDAFPQ